MLAHETGHIAGGHLSRLREQLAQAQSQMIIAMLLGIGAMVAASKSGRDIGNPSAAMLGPQSTIQRSLLAYQRSQEEQADRAGVKFLNETHQSPKGMHDTFKRMADQILFTAAAPTRTRNRIRCRPSALPRWRSYAKTSPYWDAKDSPELQLRHDMARAKLFGFLERRDTVARKYPSTDNSLPARYARAIATYRHADLRAAISQIDALIHDMPNNPYLYELKGQAYLEGGKAAEAIEPLRQRRQVGAKSGTDPGHAGAGNHQPQQSPSWPMKP